MTLGYILFLFVSSMIGAMFITIPVMVGCTFLFIIFASIPFSKARAEILQNYQGQVVTETGIEKELAIKHPNLFWLRQYTGAIILITGGVLGLGMFLLLFLLSLISG